MLLLKNVNSRNNVVNHVKHGLVCYLKDVSGVDQGVERIVMECGRATRGKKEKQQGEMGEDLSSKNPEI